VTLEQEFIKHWNESCQGDYNREGFWQECIDAGYVRRKARASKQDVENTPFAEECGVEAGSPIYLVTKAGAKILEGGH
jgi:hypothetical protein